MKQTTSCTILPLCYSLVFIIHCIPLLPSFLWTLCSLTLSISLLHCNYITFISLYFEDTPIHLHYYRFCLFLSPTGVIMHLLNSTIPVSIPLPYSFWHKITTLNVFPPFKWEVFVSNLVTLQCWCHIKGSHSVKWLALWKTPSHRNHTEANSMV